MITLEESHGQVALRPFIAALGSSPVQSKGLRGIPPRTITALEMKSEVANRLQVILPNSPTIPADGFVRIPRGAEAHIEHVTEEVLTVRVTGSRGSTEMHKCAGEVLTTAETIEVSLPEIRVGVVL